MRLKTGYKQTEVGVIPDDWEVASIGQIAKIKTGPFGTLLKASEYSREGVPVVSVSEIRQGFLRITDGTPHVSIAVTSRLPQYLLEAGDIVFGRKGGVDRSAPIRQAEGGWFLGSDGIAIRPDEKHNSEYLAFQFQTPSVKSWLLQNSTGTTMPSLNQGVLSRVQIAIPDTIFEQQGIVEALSDADLLIESLEQLLAKKRHLKQGAMQDLLTGKKRLPGFSEKWVDSTIEQLEHQGHVRLFRGKVISKKDIAQVPGDYPIYSSSVQNAGLMGSYGEFMFDEELITWSIDGGGDFFYRPRHRFSVTNVCGFMRVNTTKVNFQFLAAQLQEIHRTKSFNYLLKAHPSVIRRAYEVRLPNLDEQSAIATILSDMDAEIVALETKLAKARKLKQGMMQELLTGRIRLV